MISKNKEAIYVLILLFFSILINQYYGFIGINPIDSFFSFNSGYDILNGYLPFKDYWTITGPFIAFVQSIFFKLFGVSWFSYVFHASIFNFLLTISTFYTLYKLKLNLNYCFFYSFLVAILAYPSSGTPYVDHQATYLSIISIYCFILAISSESKFYWFFLPIILGISFLTKQTPTGHIFLIIIFLLILHLIFNFNIKKILYGFLGSLFFLIIFFTTLYLSKIPIHNFFDQYILFPLSLGKSRLDFLFPLEFNRIFLRFKLIHLSYAILIITIIKNVKSDAKNLIKEESLIIIALIAMSYSLIAHQLMTINGMFIFFIIPILLGFSHIFYLKYFKKKNFLLIFILILSIGSTSYYGYKYINKRDFMDLRGVDIKNSINANELSSKLNGLKWITPLYPEEPIKEIIKLKKAINIVDEEKRKKAIITDYQFISVILSTYDYSPSQVWFDYHANPKKDTRYYKKYKNFFINKIKENNIEVLYVIKPMWGGNNILQSTLGKNCIKKSTLTAILDLYTLLDCDELLN